MDPTSGMARSALSMRVWYGFNLFETEIHLMDGSRSVGDPFFRRSWHTSAQVTAKMSANSLIGSQKYNFSIRSTRRYRL